MPIVRRVTRKLPQGPRPPSDRDQGRKAVRDGEETVSVTFRMAVSTRDKLERLAERAGIGRAEWVRDRIDLARE